MFQVSLSTIFFVYLIIAMGLIFILWVISEYTSRTKATHIEVQNTMVCTLCFQSFIFDKNKSIVQCPFCDNYNDVEK